MDAAGLFSNQKRFVGNLSLFFNKMLARIGSIFKALYMALRVGLYLSSSIWGMPRDLSYDYFGVFVGLCVALCDPQKMLLRWFSFRLWASPFMIIVPSLCL